MLVTIIVEKSAEKMAQQNKQQVHGSHRSPEQNSHNKISFKESYTLYKISGQCSRIHPVYKDFQIFL